MAKNAAQTHWFSESLGVIARQGPVLRGGAIGFGILALVVLFISAEASGLIDKIDEILGTTEPLDLDFPQGALAFASSGASIGLAIAGIYLLGVIAQLGKALETDKVTTAPRRKAHAASLAQFTEKQSVNFRGLAELDVDERMKWALDHQDEVFGWKADFDAYAKLKSNLDHWNVLHEQGEEVEKAPGEVLYRQRIGLYNGLLFYTTPEERAEAIDWATALRERLLHMSKEEITRLRNELYAGEAA